MHDELMILGILLIIFVILPGMFLHYITLWRKQKTLLPDDERMLEDMWRSARAMEERIETIETLLDTQVNADMSGKARSARRRQAQTPDKQGE